MKCLEPHLAPLFDAADAHNGYRTPESEREASAVVYASEAASYARSLGWTAEEIAAAPAQAVRAVVAHLDDRGPHEPECWGDYEGAILEHAEERYL